MKWISQVLPKTNNKIHPTLPEGLKFIITGYIFALKNGNLVCITGKDWNTGAEVTYQTSEHMIINQLKSIDDAEFQGGISVFVKREPAGLILKDPDLGIERKVL